LVHPYFSSPWPCEDGSPQRLASAPGAPLNIQTGETLGCVIRNTLMSTMTVLGAPGEVYLLTHSVLRARLGLPTTSCVERIDPLTLKTLEKSPRLSGGPMWPGGMAVHRSGDLLVVYGRYAHRLNRHCEPQARFCLPVNEPYNSFVLLDNGLLVTKNLSDTTPAQLTVLDAHSLQPVCAHITCPEPSIARLSAVGNTVYVVGVKSIFRYHWRDDLHHLELDAQWRYDYAAGTQQSYGWDVVLDGRDAWFMDNGKHRYVISMIGAGVSRTANRLLCVNLRDAGDHSAWEVCGVAGGSVTNPPVVDTQRNIVVAFDSANRHLRAWRISADRQTLTPLWHKTGFGVASHMVLYPQSGELVTNDYRAFGEEVVVLNMETGAELGRVRTGGITQGVVFPAPGWNRDVYWCSMGRLARVFVQPAA
jgi:hypothetical protein